MATKRFIKGIGVPGATYYKLYLLPNGFDEPYVIDTLYPKNDFLPFENQEELPNGEKVRFFSPLIPISDLMDSPNGWCAASFLNFEYDPDAYPFILYYRTNSENTYIGGVYYNEYPNEELSAEQIKSLAPEGANYVQFFVDNMNKGAAISQSPFPYVYLKNMISADLSKYSGEINDGDFLTVVAFDESGKWLQGPHSNAIRYK